MRRIGKGQHGEDVPCPFDEAISALATLAFLGAGHLPGAADDPYGARVEKALTRLANVGETWALPIATEAFSEAEAMERKGRWRDAAVRGANQLLAARQTDHAWGYCTPYRPGSDVPYTALAVPALVASRDVGVELPADLASGVDAYLNSLEESKGRLAYLVAGVSTDTADAATRTPRSRSANSPGRPVGPVARLALSTTFSRVADSVKEVEQGRQQGDAAHRQLVALRWWYAAVAKFQESPAVDGLVRRGQNALVPTSRRAAAPEEFVGSARTVRSARPAAFLATALAGA